MPESSTQTIAIIGAGMVAGVHLQSVADLHNKIHLKGVLSRDPTKAGNFAAKAETVCGYGVDVYADIEALATDKSVDWTIVLTPPNARVEIVETLAAAGKSILLEKPIERTLEAARSIVEVCEKAGVKLGVVFQHRMRRASQHLAELLQSGKLGDLAIAEARVPWWREQAYYDEPGRGTYARDGGGVLISQAIHTLDLMLSLTGPVVRVQAMASTTALHQMEAEDYVTAALRFANGATGSVIASTANYPGGPESITLHFTNCVAHLQSGELNLQWHDGRNERFGEPSGTGGGKDPMAFPHEWHRSVIENFADIYESDLDPLVSGKEGLAVHALIDAIVASSNSGRTVDVSASGS